MELVVDFPFKAGKSVNWKTKEGGKEMVNHGKWRGSVGVAFTSGTTSPSTGGSAGAAAVSAILGPLTIKYVGTEQQGWLKSERNKSVVA